ncbi:MAG: prepilin-type N-terminal cleavage/methylation domain-containing protein [Candidatus Ratteibacteria bacterium]|nr:prepilin-type N-terminal cleavage/methylation domain-containing protein [Candidatus Ratteibacteria bacterium]
MKTLKRAGFTLTELLVVIAIMGMLAAILLPTLQNAREKANRAVCVGNLKVIGEAFNMYNIDNGEMPPTGDAFAGTNTATNIIKTNSGAVVGLGYFYSGPSMGAYGAYGNEIEGAEVFVCPSSNYVGDVNELISNWINPPAEGTICTYIYRAESGGNPALRLSDSKPAIVMDYNNKANNEYNHRGDSVNILFKNGNVKVVQNLDDGGEPDPNGRLTLGGTDAAGGTVDINELFRHESGSVLIGGADSYQ